ncbi:MAG: prolipoprotein diacylglyceryl transferase [Clostridia bacterium]|nr:prolipoprotein diacylglyceryl transferase [Clostridia bacterium]
MFKNHIEFPGLGLDFIIDRRAIDLGFGPVIYWYALIIVTGFILATFYGMKRAKELGTDQEHLLDALLLAVPMAIIGARIYHVAFDFESYRHNLVSVLYVWEGGISIYGAIIGAMLAFIIYAKRKKEACLPAMMDVGALGLLIGQSIGRWGNFVNGEEYGIATDLPWEMVVNGVSAHPAFLYESLWNAVGFVILHFYSKRRKFKGEIFLLYTAWYGLGRAIIESIKAREYVIPGTNLLVSQVVAIVAFVSSVAALVIMYRKKEKENYGSKDN